MSEKGFFNYFFHKSPLIRTLTVIILIALILSGIFIFKFYTRPIPYIDSIYPAVGRPGDVVVISGKNFGKERDMNYVEFGGSKLTSSSYLMWSDNTIRLVIPANVQDGLVVVGSGKLRSKPAFFANATDIPVEVKAPAVSTEPVITSVLNSKKAIGSLITILGNNFGDSRNQSKIYFTADYDRAISFADFVTFAMLTDNMIAASDDDYCYEYWSNTEIRVRIPDGAYSGVVIVDTPQGKTAAYELNIENKAGYKNYIDKKIYLMQYSVDIEDIVSKDSATITLRCPLPIENANQNSVEMTEVSPEPILENYQKTLIHQLSTDKNNSEKKYFRQTFVVPVYAIETQVNPEKIIQTYDDMDKSFFNIATKADDLIPADNENVTKLMQSICKTEKNPYKKAKLIYDYMISTYKVQEKFRKNDDDPLDLIKRKRGDAYDFAIIYTALLRAAGIPAFADCGILVSPDFMTRNHAWAEFYITGIGWIPVDVALGAGMEYNKWDNDLDVASYYFGNLDSHHVKFSRGLNKLKPFSQDSKTIQRPRSFAFQTIWEEASNSTVKYSSFWADPIVKGIY